MRNPRLFVFCIVLCFVLSAQAARTDVNFGEKVVVKFGRTINDAVCIGDDVHVFGTVKNDAVSIGGDVFVEKHGRVKGNAVSIGGDIYVRNMGEIKNDAISLAGITYVDYGGVVLGKNISFSTTEFFGDDFPEKILKILIFGPVIGLFGLMGLIIGFVISLVKLAFFLAVAVAVTYFFPEKVSVMADFTGREFWKCFFLGIVAIIIIPFLSLALFITIIGIPLIPALFVFLFIAFLYGATGIALWVGKLIPGAETRSDIMNVIIGVLILGVIKFIPAIGFLLKFFILAVSFGVIIFTRFGTQKSTSV